MIVARVVGVMNNLAVHIQVVVEAVVCVVVDPRDPEVPTRRHIGALFSRRCISVEVLADERGLVPCRVELGRDRSGFASGFIKRGEPSVVAGVAQHAVIMRVLPSQN